MGNCGELVVGLGWRRNVLYCYSFILKVAEKPSLLAKTLRRNRLANIAKVLWQFLAHFQEIEEILAHF